MKLASLLVASAATMLAVPAMAQDSGSTVRDRSQDFNGPYVSVGGGATLIARHSVAPFQIGGPSWG